MVIEDTARLRVMNDTTCPRVINYLSGKILAKDPVSIAKIIDPTYVNQKILNLMHRHPIEASIAKVATLV